jgi:nitrate/nitrite-specific signal transduction histidine kinase
MPKSSFFKKIRVRTIRARLFIAFILMAAVAVVSLTAGSAVVGYYNGQRQTLRQLDSVALSKELQLTAWSTDIQNQLATILDEEYAVDRIANVLVMAQDQKYYLYYNGAVRERFLHFLAQSKEIEELFIVNQDGRVVLSTDQDRENTLAPLDLNLLRLSETFIQLPFQTDPVSLSSPFFARPVIDTDGQLLGFLVCRTGVESLTKILADQTGLGGTGKAYLADVNRTLLLSSNVGLVHQESPARSLDGVSTTFQNQAPTSGIYMDYRGTRVIGAARWLPEFQAALLVEQDFSDALQAVFVTLFVNLLTTLVVIVLAAVVSFYISRSIAAPLVKLADTASQIAGGDLKRQAEISREDEVGILGNAFNSMTRQMNELINNLEQRVKDRTFALQNANQALELQAVQLETSQQVSREISSILDIDDLLKRVVTLISNAFGHDYIHIYLLDDEGKQLQLRSSSTDLPGLLTLSIEGKGLGWDVVRGNVAIIVNDVNQAPRYLKDENLPDVGSEMVLPLRFSQRVIGTLNVQSRNLNAFTPADERIFQSLGNQITIAIENARLYQNSRELAAMEERTRLARDLHDSVTQSLYSLNLMVEGWRLSAEPDKANRVDDYLSRTGQVIQQMLKEMRLMIYEMRPPIVEEVGLLVALHTRLDAVENRSAMQTHLKVIDFVKLPCKTEEQLYLIAQEALNNTLKHANATAVTIQIYARDEHVVLEVVDDGKGFRIEEAEVGGGFGLTSMRDRAAKLGGRLTISSEPGSGTTITVDVPSVV